MPGPGGPSLRGGLVGRPQPGDAGGGAHQRAVAHPFAPRPAVAEGAAAREHDPGIQGAQRVEGKPKRGKGSRLEVGEYRVGVGDQAAEDLLALCVAQVEAQREVVAVRPGE